VIAVPLPVSNLFEISVKIGEITFTSIWTRRHVRIVAILEKLSRGINIGYVDKNKLYCPVPVVISMCSF
jgi:hypothetical protein